MEWDGNRSHIRWEYRRVTWPDFAETGETYDMVSEGEHELSFFTSIKESGKLSFTGDIPKPPDMIRAYYCMTNELGEPVNQPVFTMVVAPNEQKSTPNKAVGSVSLYGVLKIASDKQYGLPYTIASGVNAVQKAKEMAEGLGLIVNAKESSFVTTSPHTFSPDDSYLTIINWLLSAAGYQSAFTDWYGTVQMQPYVSQSNREALWDFSEGDKSMISAQIVEELNTAETPNVVRLYAETDAWSVWAAAYNEDLQHLAGLPSNGWREKTLSETVSDLSSTTAQDAIDELEMLASKKITDNSSSIRYGEVEVIAYMPVHEGDPCRIAGGGMELNGTVTNVKVTHSARSPMTVKAREYVTATFKPRTEGGAL